MKYSTKVNKHVDDIVASMPSFERDIHCHFFTSTGFNKGKTMFAKYSPDNSRGCEVILKCFPGKNNILKRESFAANFRIARREAEETLSPFKSLK